MVANAARALLQFALVILFVGGAAVTVQWMIATKPSAPQQATSEPVYAVRAVQATAAFNQPIISVFGEVSARRSVEMRALVAGPVVEASARLIVGERVEAGEVLVRIDPFSYEGAVDEAQANLAESEARLVEASAELAATEKDLERIREQVTLAERDLARARRLVKSRNVAERTVDERELTLVQRRQSLEAAESARTVQKARIDQQKAAVQRLKWRLRQAERDLADTVLRAPFAAIVRSENVGLGKRLSVNDVIAQLYEADGLDVRFTLSDSQFGRINADETPLVGREADITWAVGGEPIRARAVIDRIGPEVSSITGGVSILGRIQDAAANAALRPGAFVTVALTDRGFGDSFRLPEEAFYDGDHVFTLEPTEPAQDAGRAVWSLSRQPATALAWDGSEVLVRGDFDGKWVLTSRLAEAGEGVKVRILNTIFGEKDRDDDAAGAAKRSDAEAEAGPG